MSFTKLVLPLAVLAAVAHGQDSCSASATLTVTAAADLSQVTGCSTYSGSITIPTDLSDAGNGQGQNQLSVDGVEKIVGNFTINNAIQLTGISFGSLKSVSGIQFGDLTVFSSFSMPQIQQINQLNLTALPALQQFSFGSDGVTQASSILITNTGLSSLQGIDQLESVDSFNVNNNPALQNITLNVRSIKNALKIEANDGFQSGLSTSFPSLQSAMNMTFRNCSSIDLPSLMNVSQYLGFYGNTMETQVLPNLTTTGGLVFVDNTKLSNISIPNLTSVNASLQIANNTMLKKIDGIQKLSIVTASLDFNGNFTEVDLPNLTQVKGAFNLQTSGDFDCSPFDAYKKSKGVIKGNYVCSGSQAKPGGAGTKPSGTSSASGSKSTSGAMPTGAVSSAALGASLMLVGFAQLAL